MSDPEVIEEQDNAGLCTDNDTFDEAISETQDLSEDTDINERLRSASLTGSLHELEDDVKKMTLEPSVKEEDHEEDDDEFHDAKESSPISKQSSPSTCEDLTLSKAWRSKTKHFFILSEAGKPIYSRHGDEDQLASLMAVMQATVSFVQDMGDNLRAVRTGQGTNIVFLNKRPLILVAVSHTAESPTQLFVQLTYLYHQMLSVLTLTQLSRIFEQRKGYDLRKMIAGSERLLDSLANAMDQDPASYIMSAVRVLPMVPSLRESISSVIKQHCSKTQNVVFALLMAENHLITLVRMKKYLIHPVDLHLIFNLVNSSESFKLSESWTPICLPKFDSSGFMHAHVSYLSDESPLCLFMLTVERDIFFPLSEARKKIVNALEKTGNIQKLEELVGEIKSKAAFEEIGIPEIKHFIYKSKSTAQFLSFSTDKYEKDAEAMTRLNNVYFIIQARLHSPTRPFKLLYFSGSLENVIAWATKDFELCATFDPITEKSEAFAAVNKLIKWIRNKETHLFITSSPTF